MPGGRGRRRRQAAEGYEKENETRWVDVIRVRLPESDPESHPPDKSSHFSSLQQEAEEVMLELSGFQSLTRTIFARIFRRAEAGGKSNGDSKRTEEKRNGDAKTINRCCWKVEYLVGAIVNEIYLQENATEQVSDENNPKPKGSSPTLVESPQTLLELGSVWVLDPATSDRPQNKPVWKRLLKEGGGDLAVENDMGSSLFWFDETMTLRVHSRPSRFPMARNFGKALKQQEIDVNSNLPRSSTGSNIYGGIVYERAIENSHSIVDTAKKCPMGLAFAVLNKPVGVPSHSTVDNAVENILYQYQKHRKLSYASLPQRLDTETSGLVLVATLPKFATYFCKLLEQKTNTALTTNQTPKTPSASPSSSHSIQKRYRCLVALPDDSSSEEIRDVIQRKYIQPGKIVEHFVDANSNNPKTFVDASDFEEFGFPDTPAETTETTTRNNSIKKSGSHSAGSTHKWQLCKLRIWSMSIPIKPQKSLFSSARKFNSSLKDILCSELEIELLTGRNHQIRGQMAALGCPVLGDPLYGNLLDKNSPTPPPQRTNWRDRSSIRMALQCCELSFQMDPSIVRKAPSPAMHQTRGNPSHRPALSATKASETPNETDDQNSGGNVSLAAPSDCPSQLGFRLDSAWWRDG